MPHSHGASTGEKKKKKKTGTSLSSIYTIYNTVLSIVFTKEPGKLVAHDHIYRAKIVQSNY